VGGGEDSFIVFPDVHRPHVVAATQQALSADVSFLLLISREKNALVVGPVGAVSTATFLDGKAPLFGSRSPRVRGFSHRRS
jgi:hypothetical protein